MKLTLICEHGTRSVETDRAAGDVQSLAGMRSFATDAMPRCPYCEVAWSPAFYVQHGPEQAA